MDSLSAKPYAISPCKKSIGGRINKERPAGLGNRWVIPQFLQSCYTIRNNPHVSIIIPTKDHVDILKRCIHSILDKTAYKNYGILIIDNQSTNQETFEYYASLTTHPKIKIVHYDNPFNFSAINNYAVARVTSPYILFLNNDTEIIADEWLSAMLEYAQRG